MQQAGEISHLQAYLKRVYDAELLTSRESVERSEDYTKFGLVLINDSSNSFSKLLEISYNHSDNYPVYCERISRELCVFLVRSDSWKLFETDQELQEILRRISEAYNRDL